MTAPRPGAPVHPGPGPLPPERDRPRRRGDSGAAPRTGNPVIAPGGLPAVCTAALALPLALTAPLPRPALACVVAVLQAVTAAGWFRLNGMWPARQGIALAFLAGLTADLALLATDRAQAATALLGALGVWSFLVLVLHLRNHADPDERLYALTAALTSTALTVTAAGHLATATVSEDAVTASVAAVAVAVAVSALARAVQLPRYTGPPVAVLAATVAGAAVGKFTDIGDIHGAAFGAAAGVCAVAGRRVASYDHPSRFVHLTAGVALPLTLAAPAAYLLARVLT